MENPSRPTQNLRNEEPVMFDERVGLWVVARYDDVKAVFEDWETFSSRERPGPGPQARPAGHRRS